MSFRGLQKSVIRAPQQIKQKFNIGDQTKDAVYIDAERRFQELEVETKRLHDESKKYFEAINGMLDHQIEFSKAMTEVYRPISGRMSDPDSLVVHGNPEGIRACEEYEAVVKDLQETLAPELEMIESRVVRPADELLDVIKVIRKTVLKREHKKLDHDRHRAALKKLQDKKERSAKDEKNLWKAENDVEQATQEFTYFNDLLKDELPRLFVLERDFIQPLFQSFYYMQLNIFYTLHERMQRCDIGYFDLTLDLEEAFQRKRGDVQEQAEKLTIVKFKTTGARRPPKYGGPRPGQPALEGNKPAGLLTSAPSSSTVTSPESATTPASATQAWERAHASAASAASAASPSTTLKPWQNQPQETATASATDTSWQQPGETVESPPPPYSAPSSSAGHHQSLAAVIAAKSKPPPPPKPKPSRLSANPHAETVVALYDYSAQAEGDLSFFAGDVIEIVTRTANENEWWIGRLQGKEGQFPGNYVKLNS